MKRIALLVATMTAACAVEQPEREPQTASTEQAVICLTCRGGDGNGGGSEWNITQARAYTRNYAVGQGYDYNNVYSGDLQCEQDSNGGFHHCSLQFFGGVGNLQIDCYNPGDGYAPYCTVQELGG